MECKAYRGGLGFLYASPFFYSINLSLFDDWLIYIVSRFYQILEGILTIAVAILSAFWLRGCDSPEEASFLTPAERCDDSNYRSTFNVSFIYHFTNFLHRRQFISYRQRHDLSSVNEDDSVKSIYVWKALLDWQVCDSSPTLNFFPGVVSLKLVCHKVWVGVLLYICVDVPLYADALFLP
jgi:hypothetical protein